MWTFSSNFEAVHPLPPLADLLWGGIFTPWTKFDWGGTDGGGLNSGGGGFFGDASGSRGAPLIGNNPENAGRETTKMPHILGWNLSGLVTRGNENNVPTWDETCMHVFRMQ